MGEFCQILSNFSFVMHFASQSLLKQENGQSDSGSWRLRSRERAGADPEALLLNWGWKERVRLQRLGFELGMELAAQEEGVAGDLDDLDVGGVGGGSGQAKACSGE